MKSYSEIYKGMLTFHSTQTPCGRHVECFTRTPISWLNMLPPLTHTSSTPPRRPTSGPRLLPACCRLPKGQPASRWEPAKGPCGESLMSSARLCFFNLGKKESKCLICDTCIMFIMMLFDFRLNINMSRTCAFLPATLLYLNIY